MLIDAQVIKKMRRRHIVEVRRHVAIGSIQVNPLAVGPARGLIHSPTGPYRTLTPVEFGLELWAIFADPTIHDRMIDALFALKHHVFEITENVIFITFKNHFSIVSYNGIDIVAKQSNLHEKEAYQHEREL